MITDDDKDKDVSICANCCKEGRGDEINNICNKCKQVKYCNAACKKKHRHKHKKLCEEYQRLAAERAAKLHDIELFKQPSPAEDCSICFLCIPTMQTGRRYQLCCGKVICSGCLHAPVYDDRGNEVDSMKCPFCRTPWPVTNEEEVQRSQKRVELNDAHAIYELGIDYRDGTCGYAKDHKKALELWHQAGKLGNVKAHCSIGVAYNLGRGVEVDMKKAKYYYEQAAMLGDVTSRHNLGVMEVRLGNYERALKHFMIAVGGGYTGSLERIKKLYTNGNVTKDDYTKALESYQEYLGEIKSVQRDEAAAFTERYRYY